MPKFWGTYGKAIVAFLLAVVTAVQAQLSDGRMNTGEWIQVAIAAVTALGVLIIPIHPEWTWTKTAVAALLAFLNALVAALVGGIDTSDLTQLVLSVLTVLSVGAAPALSRRSLVPLR
jgi:hypothetical protein